MSLSSGALQNLMQGVPVPLPIYIQLLDMKPVANKGGGKRHRMQVNDGQNSCSMMLASQLAQQIESEIESYTMGTILKVNEILPNEVHGKRLLIAINAERVGMCTDVIGNPVPLNSEGGAPAGAAPQDQNIPPPGAAPPYGAQVKPENAGAGPMYGQPPAMQPNNQSFPGQGPSYGQPPPMQQQQNMGGPGGGYGNPPPMQQQNMRGPGPGPNYGGGPPPGAGPSYGGPPPGMQQQGGYQQQQGYQQQGGPGFGQGGPSFGNGPTGGGPGYGYSGPPGGGGGPGYGFGGRQPQPNYGGGPVSRNEAAARIVPISSLNPYSGRWAIKARCTSKGDMRRWNGARGEGKLFSFDLLDKDGGEIRVTAFNDQAEKFFQLVEVGKILMVGKASLTHKKPQFNNTNHQFEIRLERDSQVEVCPEDDETAAIPSMQYHFRRIEEISGIEANTMIDVIGVVEQVNDWQTITRKTGEETRKRSIILRDNSGRSIEATLWGAFVDEPGNALEQAFKSGARPVVAMKSVRVGDFNGKTLSTLNSSAVAVEPRVPEAASLRQWYDQGGNTVAAQPLSAMGGAGGMGGGGGRAEKRTTFAAVRDENLGKGEKPDWITVAAPINFIRNENHPLVYPACPRDFNGRMCQKKMVELQAGQYNCERCNAATTEPAWRYMIQLSAVDHKQVQWLTAFGDTGDSIMGVSAAQYKAMEQNDAGIADKLIQSALFKHCVFRLKVAEDNYNDESRVKVSIFKVEPAVFAKEGWLMLDYIQKLEQGQQVLLAKDPNAAPAAAGGGGGFGGGGGMNMYGGGGGPGGGGPGMYGNQSMGGPPGGGGPGGMNMYGNQGPVGGPPGGGMGMGGMGGGGGGMNTPPPRNPYSGGGGPPNYGQPPPYAGGGPQGGPPTGGYGGPGGPMGGGGPTQYGGPGGGGMGGGPGGGMGGGAPQGYGGPGGGGGYMNQGYQQGPPPPQQQQYGGGGGGYGGPPGGGGMYGGPPPQQQQQPNMGAPLW